MSKGLSFICVLALLLTSQVCLGQSPTNVSSESNKPWEEFSLPNGQFVVSLPEKPKSLAIPLDQKLNGVVVHILGVDKDLESYAAGYIEFPTPVDDASKSKAMLDGIAEKEVAKVGGRMLRQADVAINGYSGREVTLEVSDGFWVDRFYLVGKRVYFVSAFAAKSPADAKEITKEQNVIIQRFLESFKLK